jgi:hypothetical protein
MLISLFLSFTPLKLRACYEEYDGIELLERRVPVGSEDIGERVQHRIDGASWPEVSPKDSSKTCQYPLRADTRHVAQFH